MLLKKGQLGILVVSGTLVLAIVLAVFSLNRFSKVQAELKSLYEVSFENTPITSVTTHPYEGGRGTYEKFHTLHPFGVFPVMLEDDFYELKRCFKEGSLLNKKSNSKQIAVNYEGSDYLVKIRDFNQVNNRVVPLLLFGLFFAVVLFLRYIVTKNRV